MKPDLRRRRSPPCGGHSFRGEGGPRGGRAGCESEARFAGVSALLLIAALLEGCASLPRDVRRAPSSVLADTSDTQIGRSVRSAEALHPGESGFYVLNIPEEAFAARVALARRAERSLDVQYYIWHGDTTGTYMLQEIWNAAERGVRVRMLLDDNGIGGLDRTLAALDSHASIEVRLFNPYPNRGVKVFGYLTDFGRLNRRMHNKSFTADGQATIVGGRNIGDEYFGAGEDMVFTDLDAVAAGPIAVEVGAEFDLYWNSESAYPLESIVPPAGPDAVKEMTARFAAVEASPEAARYVAAVKATKLVDQLIAHDVQLEWARVELVYDPP
ncbi:MAG TPA: phospholipase D-like domain-containing protein, partial [Thermoanaerobaculia bacterium]